MAGLLSSMGSQPANTPATDSGGADDGDEEGKQPNVTPEEQAAYDQFVQNGLDVIYGPGQAPSGAGQGGDVPGVNSMQAPASLTSSAPSAAPPTADPDADSDNDARAGGDTDADAPAQGGNDPNMTPAGTPPVTTPPTAPGVAAAGAPGASPPGGQQPSGPSGAHGARPDILNRLRESSSPVTNLANTTVWLVTNLETSAEKAKAPWTQDDQMKSDIIMHGGQALLEELADVCEAAGIHDFTDKELQGAWYQGLDLYRQTATDAGALDPESLKAQFNQIQAADEKGDVDSVVPGLSQVKKDG